jgi:acetyl-CoA C-acetyltransferase
MRVAGSRTLELAGITHDDCAFVDLYSCFPVAVQLAQRELRFDPSRDFTITGGLTFAAGPVHCYCILPLTRAVGLLRDDPAQRAFLTGNGGVFTKHSALVLAGEPPELGFRTMDSQADVDALPSRPTATGPAPDVMLETYTVTFDRERRPERAILACLDQVGSRHWAESADPDTMTELLGSDCCERPVRLDGRAAMVS